MSFLKEFWEFLKFRKKYWLIPILLVLVFFIIITPTSFIMKALGKDLLNLKKNNNKSYWIKKSPIKSKMKNQF